MGVLRGTARPSRQAELGRAGPGRAESSLAEPDRLGTGGGRRLCGLDRVAHLTALRATGQNRHRPRCI